MQDFFVAMQQKIHTFFDFRGKTAVSPLKVGRFYFNASQGEGSENGKIERFLGLSPYQPRLQGRFLCLNHHRRCEARTAPGAP